ncbi:MAG: glycosyltransferase family 9 protein [Bacteroidota bacterium]|nr:glycosyltransferase family 9 protein [Bacteroidota bacterium]
MHSFLVIQTASIGDVILATPVIEKLHRFFPDVAIDILVKKGNDTLFTGHPFLNRVIVWDKKEKKYSRLFQLAREIRKTKYDAVINMQRFASTGFLTAFSGSKIRIGFKKNPFSFFFTHRIHHPIGNGIHETVRNLSLIEPLTDSSGQLPRLYPGQADETIALKYAQGRYYTISPASLWFTKQFPEEKWIDFIRTISPDAKIFLLGSREDESLCDRIIKKSGHSGAISLAGKLSLLASAALMKNARMNYTNDSAPMHLASSVDAPVTVIYCSTVPDFGFGPLSNRSNIIETDEKLSCRPCGLHGYRTCPEKHFRCALSISVSRLTDLL